MLDFIPKEKTFKTYNDLLLESEIENQTGLSSSTLARVEQQEIRDFVAKLLSLADSTDQMILKIQSVVDLSLQNKTVKGLGKIKVLRAELHRQMYEMVGANTGYYKNDYAVFMTAKQDDVMGSVLEAIEAQIKRLTDYIQETEV